MSKFKSLRPRINSTDVLVATTSFASIIAHVSDMLQFIPARAAAMVVLIILQTVQEIDNNKVACYKLARRSAKILVDLNVRMAGRWESAPKSLVENIQEFEKVLVCIRDFMQDLAKVGWMGRLLKKGSIEAALCDFYELLNDAERTFQIATLVEIHYAVGVLGARSAATSNETLVESASSKPSLGDSEPKLLSSTPEVCDSSQDDVLSKSLVKRDSFQAPTVHFEKSRDVKIEDDIGKLQLQAELKELECFGFKRYHQADLRLLSEVKFAKSDSFWKHTMVANACGNQVLVKRYDTDGEGGKGSLRRWLHDIKMLRNLYHPNLPQLAGYSDEKSPARFVLLAQAKLRDPSSYLLSALRNMTISESAIMALKMSAAFYVQRQLSFDERQTQVFVAEASYAIDTESGKIVLGIPPPPEEGSYQGFGYPLSESLLGTTLKILPAEKHLSKGTSRDIVDLLDKVAHIRALAYMLLPDQQSELSCVSEELLEDVDFDLEPGSMPLSRIRNQCISAGIHGFSWDIAIHSCQHTFTVGDIGYICHDQGRLPMTDASRFDCFVKVGNIVDDLPGWVDGEDAAGALSVIREVTGTNGRWINGFYRTEEAWPFMVPGDVEGWAASLAAGAETEVHVRHTARMASVNEAWRYLLHHAEERAANLGVDPYGLIIITKTVLGQIYKVHDWNPPRPAFPGHPSLPPHGAPRFPHGGFGHHQHQQPQLPRILYLFTSHREEFVPFIAENPSAVAKPGSRPDIRGVTLRTAWHRPEAFIGYIQLSAEDFASR